MPARRKPLETKTTVIEKVHIGQRVSIGLIAISLSLISLALGLALFNSPAALLIVPTPAPLTASSASAVTLTWTAPGDDGNTGQATGYQLRYSTSPLTAANFASATVVSPTPIPQPAGSTETYTVTGLQPSTTYFFGLKSYDEAGNTSVISNIATKTTDALPEACVPTYTCTSWSACTNGTQTRTCSVTNGCASNVDQPVITQSCTSPSPDALTGAGGTIGEIDNPMVVAGVAQRTIPVVRTINYISGRVLREWLVFSRTDRNGTHVATGDVTGDHRADVVVGTGIGSDPLVKIYTDAGELLTQFDPYQTSRGIGVYVATGDIDGDGVDEIITVPSRSAAHIRVFRYSPAQHRVNAVTQAFAYDSSQRNGFSLAVGDLDLDGKDEIAIAARTNALTVSVFDYGADKALHRVSKFVPYGRLFESGITLAIGDINGDGRGDIVTAPGPNLYTHIKVFTEQGQELAGFLPTSTAYRGGVDLATSDINHDGKDEIITGSYGHGDPGVWAFRYSGLTKHFERIKAMFVYPRTMQDGLRIDATPHT